MIYGAVLAGGIGTRIQRHLIPKQFISICGTPIIIITLRAFIQNKQFDAVYVAVHQEWINYLKMLLQRYLSVLDKGTMQSEKF